MDPVISSFFTNLPDIFFHKLPGHHDLMSAPQAFQTEIRSRPQDLPFHAAAGVFFYREAGSGWSGSDIVLSLLFPARSADEFQQSALRRVGEKPPEMDVDAFE